MNKMKFFLTRYALLATLFSTPFGTSCLYGSNESISEEGKVDAPLLFKGRKGSTIQKTKLQKFLAPEFKMDAKCWVELASQDDLDPALKKLQSLARQFVREVGMRETDVSRRVSLFNSTFVRIDEMTINATSSLMPLFIIGSYRLIDTVVESINNSLLKKSEIKSGSRESGTDSAMEPTYSAERNQRAFHAVKKALGLELLTFLQDDGEDMSKQLGLYNEMEQGFDDEEDDKDDSESEGINGSQDEEELLREVIACEEDTIAEQNKAYGSSKRAYQKFLAALADMEKIRATLPMKNHAICTIFLSLGFETEDVEKTMHFLFDGGEFATKSWPLFSKSPLKPTKTKLTFKNSEDFLKSILQIMKENPIAEATSIEPAYFVEEEPLLEDLLCHEQKSSDLSDWAEHLSTKSQQNSITLSDLNSTNEELKGIVQKAAAEIAEKNEPLVRFFKGFYGYLGGKNTAEFIDVFVTGTQTRRTEKVEFSGAKFPSTKENFINGLWRFLHADDTML
jgi:hypothetical protein